MALINCRETGTSVRMICDSTNDRKKPKTTNGSPGKAATIIDPKAAYAFLALLINVATGLDIRKLVALDNQSKKFGTVPQCDAISKRMGKCPKGNKPAGNGGWK